MNLCSVYNKTVLNPNVPLKKLAHSSVRKLREVNQPIFENSMAAAFLTAAYCSARLPASNASLLQSQGESLGGRLPQGLGKAFEFLQAGTFGRSGACCVSTGDLLLVGNG